jgi:hypothetical protein
MQSFIVFVSGVVHRFVSAAGFGGVLVEGGVWVTESVFEPPKGSALFLNLGVLQLLPEFTFLSESGIDRGEVAGERGLGGVGRWGRCHRGNILFR